MRADSIRVLACASLLLAGLPACGPSGDIRLFSSQAGAASDPPVTRDPKRAPYASSSLWNTSLGDQASLAEVSISAASAGVRSEAVVVLLELETERLSVQHSDAGWSGADRCAASAPEHFEARAPSDFLVTEAEQRSSLPVVALQADGRTLRQGLPFARCTENAPATIQYDEQAGDLFHDGQLGANGGSGLSALGGLLRLGELLPDRAPPRHALAIHVFSDENLWNASSPDECFRWPASRGDVYCVDVYGGTEPELRMGSLLALPPGGLPLLRTDAARQLAWTLQNYGAYVVNDAGSPSYVFNVELSPFGWFVEDFERAWGFSFQTRDMTSDWGQDIQALFDALQVVTDNGPGLSGGAGARLQPPLPALREP